jgi:hypothetical protein
MQLALPLDKMTTIEKLRAIEDIWDHLCHSNAEIPSPSWHEQLLHEREENLAQGTATFVELNEAKRILNQRLS